MIGLRSMLMMPKMIATTSSVSAFAASPCPATTIPGTTQAATPSAAADTRIRRRIVMALFLQHEDPFARPGDETGMPRSRRPRFPGAGDAGFGLLLARQVLREQRQVGGAETVGGSVELMPVRVDQLRRAHLVECRSLVGAEQQRRPAQVVEELLVGARPDDHRRHGRT